MYIESRDVNLYIRNSVLIIDILRKFNAGHRALVKTKVLAYNATQTRFGIEYVSCSLFFYDSTYVLITHKQYIEILTLQKDPILQMADLKTH